MSGSLNNKDGENKSTGGVYRVITPGTKKLTAGMNKPSVNNTDSTAQSTAGVVNHAADTLKSTAGTVNRAADAVKSTAGAAQTGTGTAKGSTESSVSHSTKSAAPGSLYKSTVTGTGSASGSASRKSSILEKIGTSAGSGSDRNNGSGKINPFKRIGISAISALVFGVIASVVFLGVTNFGMSKIGNKTEPETAVEAQTEAPEEEMPQVTLIPTIQADEITSEDEAKPSSNSDFTTAALDGRGTLSTTEVVERSMPAMVSITGMSVQQVQSFFGTQEYEAGVAGTGIIVGKTDSELLIATNNHIVEGTKDITVTFVDEKSVAAVVKGVDADMDLAIVSVPLSDIEEDTLNAISIITMGDSTELKAGEEVVAIGNALGYGQSVSRGVVSAANRVSVIDGSEKTLIQTDAAINPGNSGGALINMEGELIGINEAKDVATEVEGVGYAIPISLAKPILEELMNGETRIKYSEEESGYLGIASSYSIDEDRAQANNAPEGVYVEYLIEGGAAAESGIRPGDIITRVNDTTVKSMDKLKEELSYYKAGETVKVTLYRYGDKSYEEMTFDVTLKGAESLNYGVAESQEGETAQDEENPEGYGEMPENEMPEQGGGSEDGNGINGNGPEGFDGNGPEGFGGNGSEGYGNFNEDEIPDIEDFFGDGNNSQGGFSGEDLFRYFFGR